MRLRVSRAIAARCSGRSTGVPLCYPTPGISQAQASRLLPDLVALGVVDRREVPPASLFRLVPEHVASRALLARARSTDTVLHEMGRLADYSPIRRRA